MTAQSDILDKVNLYYTNKVLLHGATPAGADWNSVESQELRFEQLLKLISQRDTFVKELGKEFSILDYGCGYGAMYGYMLKYYKDFKYLGYDISKEMIKNAASQYTPAQSAEWKFELSGSDVKDYVIASGIFNVKQETAETYWEKYIIDTLHEFNKHSTKGFAFNALSLYSDKGYRKDYLHYADPNYLFDYCKKNFSYYVSLLHDYPLYEFTIIVYKN